MNKIIVSVIIPCFNHGKFIDDAVNSVLNQTCQDFEIIIINDGSTDDFTVSKLMYFDKPKTRVIHTANRGLAAARNEGIKASSGRYLQFLDADDVISEDKFTIQIRQLEKGSKYSLSYSDYLPATETDLTIAVPGRYLNPRFYSEQYLKELISAWEKGLSIPVHCFLFSTALFKENNIWFDETLVNHEDWDCWMKIFSLHPEVYYTDQKLATYRIHDNAMCADRHAMKRGHLQALNKQRRMFKNNKTLYFLILKKIIWVKYIQEIELNIGSIIRSLNKQTKS